MEKSLKAAAQGAVKLEELAAKWSRNENSEYSLPVPVKVFERNFPKVELLDLQLGDVIHFTRVVTSEEFEKDGVDYFEGMTSSVKRVSLKVKDIFSRLDVTSMTVLYEYYSMVMATREKEEERFVSIPPIKVVGKDKDKEVHFSLVHVEIHETPKVETPEVKQPKRTIPIKEFLEQQEGEVIDEAEIAEANEDLIVFKNPICEKLAGYSLCDKENVAADIGKAFCKVHSIRWSKDKTRKVVWIACSAWKKFLVLNWEEFKNSLKYSGYPKLSELDFAVNGLRSNYLKACSFSIIQKDLWHNKGKSDEKFISSLTIKEHS